MLDLLRRSVGPVAAFLAAKLPAFGDDWWTTRVLDRLSVNQARIAREKRVATLFDLDIAALLRVADQNWSDLAAASALPRDGRNLVRELISVRNRWAHAGAEAVSPRELYRDADTLERFLTLIGAQADVIAAVARTRDAALREMAGEAERAGSRAAPNPAAVLSSPRPPAPEGLGSGAGPPDAPRQADAIRRFVLERHVEEARRAGTGGFRVRAGDVHKAMGLANALPAVCSAIGGRKFAALASASLVGRTGRANSTTTEFFFRFLDDAPGAVGPGSPDVVAFDDDASYLRWIRDNPRGFVLNLRRRRDPEYVVLHRASCPLVTAPDRVAGAYAERDYRKVGAASVAALSAVARAEGRADGSFSRCCAICDPLGQR